MATEQTIPSSKRDYGRHIYNEHTPNKPTEPCRYCENDIRLGYNGELWNKHQASECPGKHVRSQPKPAAPAGPVQIKRRRTRKTKSVQQEISNEYHEQVTVQKQVTPKEFARLSNTKPGTLRKITKRFDTDSKCAEKLSRKQSELRSEGSGKTKPENRVLTPKMVNCIRMGLRFHRGDPHEAHKLSLPPNLPDWPQPTDWFDFFGNILVSGCFS